MVPVWGEFGVDGVGVGLDEMVATRDLRRLCDLFGLSITGAERYRAALDHPGLTPEAE